jgi:hypothetical protein
VRNRIRGEEGQVAPAALVLILTLLAVGAVLTDGLHLLDARHRAYRVASDAALQGTRAGADYASYVTAGAVRLDAVAAGDAARDVVAGEMAEWGQDAYTVTVEVLEGGGTVLDFPSHPNASQVGRTEWQSSEPAVGVYLEVPIDTLLMGALGLDAVTEVHAFAAAGLSEVN